SLVRLAFEDTAANLSLILHRGPSAIALAVQTLKAVRTLCDAWVACGDDRIVSFNIGVAYPDRTVYFSYAGHVVDLQKMFLAAGETLPASPSDVGGWAKGVLAHLTALFPPLGDVPRLSQMLRQSG